MPAVVREAWRALLVVACFSAAAEAFIPGLVAVNRAGRITMSAATKPSFSPSKEQLGPAQIPLQRSWFQAWGFAPPEPPSEGKMGFSAAKKGGKGGKGGKGKAAPPTSGTNSKLFCKAPGEDLVTVFRADIGDAAAALSEEEIGEWWVDLCLKACIFCARLRGDE